MARDKSIDRLIEALQSSDEITRAEATRRLGRLGNGARPFLTLLVDLLSDSSRSVRIASCQSLHELEWRGVEGVEDSIRKHKWDASDTTGPLMAAWLLEGALTRTAEPFASGRHSGPASGS